jgi:ParB-like chromosome segregation protein Spo0J
MYQMIQMQDLIPHPENSNRMAGNFMKKLEENIKKSGNYETITVRPHPELEGKFQILNGHHRVDILKRVGIEEVKCDVWEVSDSEARLLIATLNRLEGQDVPELRMSLLKNLMDDYDPSELESLIPESTKQLEDMIELWKEDFEAVQKQIEESTSRFESEIQDLRILDFFLNSEQYRLIVKTLDEVKDNSCLKDRNEALYELAKYHKSDDRTLA